MKNGYSQPDDIKKVVSYKSVTDELINVQEYKAFIANLDPGFVNAAIQTSFRRVIQGKK